MSKNYNEIGDLLRHARGELNVDILVASRHLHIRAHYLQALENGELEKLPSAAYVKGYLQSYASFLRLDKDEIIRRFEQLENSLPERAFFFPQVFSKKKKPTNAMVWGGVSATFFLYILWVIMFKPPSLPEFAVEPPPEELPIIGITFNVACAVPQVVLYPSCYRTDLMYALNVSTFPLPRYMETIMETYK